MVKNYQIASQYGHTPAADVAQVAAQGAGVCIHIKRIVFSVPAAAGGTLLLKAGTAKTFPLITITATCLFPIYDSGPIDINLPANTALNATDTGSSTTDTLIQWETAGGFP